MCPTEISIILLTCFQLMLKLVLFAPLDVVVFIELIVNFFYRLLECLRGTAASLWNQCTYLMSHQTQSNTNKHIAAYHKQPTLWCVSSYLGNRKSYPLYTLTNTFPSTLSCLLSTSTCVHVTWANWVGFGPDKIPCVCDCACNLKTYFLLYHLRSQESLCMHMHTWACC